MDKIFKIGLLVLGFGYLSYLFGVGAKIDTANEHVTNQVGRYHLHTAGNSIGILDTTNAKLYVLAGEKTEWSDIGPQIINKP